MKRAPQGLVIAALLAVAPGASAADEATTLEARLGRETAELSTNDCAAACKALASIRRATDRICELEPGPRCDAARAKAEDATKRVRDACPECAIARLEDDHVKKPGEEGRATTPPADTPSAKPAAAPAPERSEARGCRSCATSSGAPDRGDFAVFAVAALLLGRRLKKKRDRL